MKLFNIDSPMMQALSKIADLFILNLLFMVCCIPIITIGTSLTALYTVTLKTARNEESYVFRSFFKAFKDNFKISTLSWLILLIAGTILFVDFRYAVVFPEPYNQIIRVATVFLSILYLLLITYLFPYIARFENTLKDSFKNAFLLSVTHLPYTFLFLVIGVLAIILTFLLDFQVIGFLWIVIGFSGLAYINSILFRRIFAKFE